MPRRYESCRNGHRRTGANTYPRGRWVECRVCRAIAQRRRRATKREPLPPTFVDFVQHLKRKHQIHVHLIVKRHETYLRVMDRNSPLCDQDGRCWRLPVAA